VDPSTFHVKHGRGCAVVGFERCETREKKLAADRAEALTQSLERRSIELRRGIVDEKHAPSHCGLGDHALLPEHEGRGGEFLLPARRFLLNSVALHIQHEIGPVWPKLGVSERPITNGRRLERGR
jgi:hypothetical protein